MHEHRGTSPADMPLTASDLPDVMQHRGRTSATAPWPGLESHVPEDASPDRSVCEGEVLEQQKHDKPHATVCAEGNSEDGSCGSDSVIESRYGSFYASLLRAQPQQQKPRTASQGGLPARDAERACACAGPLSTLEELLAWRQELVRSRLDAQPASSPDRDSSSPLQDGHVPGDVRFPVVYRSGVAHTSLPASPCRGWDVTAVTTRPKAAVSLPCRLPRYAADEARRCCSSGRDASSAAASSNASFATLRQRVSAVDFECPDEGERVSTRLLFFLFMLLFLVFLIGAPLFLDGLFMLF